MSFSTLETEIRDFDNQLQPSLQRGRAGNTVGARSQTSTFLRTEWQEKEQKKTRIPDPRDSNWRRRGVNGGRVGWTAWSGLFLALILSFGFFCPVLSNLLKKKINQRYVFYYLNYLFILKANANLF